MVSLLWDENMNQRVLRGLKLRLPNVDVVVAQNVGLQGVEDEEVLEFANSQGRVVVTHDVATVPQCAHDRLRQGLQMPGIIAVPKDMPVGKAIEDIEMLLMVCKSDELANIVTYLPI